MASFASSPLPASALIDLSKRRQWDELISALGNCPNSANDPSAAAAFVAQLQFKDDGAFGQSIPGFAYGDDGSGSDDDDDDGGDLPEDPTGMSFLHICAMMNCPVEVVHAAKRCWDSVAPPGYAPLSTFLSNEKCSDGKNPVHLYCQYGSDETVLQYLAYLGGSECLTAVDGSGQHAIELLAEREDDGSAPGLSYCLDFAQTAYLAFRESFEAEHPELLIGERDLEFYKGLVEKNPRALITKDANGNSPLEKARLANEPEEVVVYLEEKTETAKTVNDEFVTFESDEDFAEKFHAWDSV